MNNVFKRTLALGLVAGLTGCSTVTVEQGTAKYDKEAGDEAHEMKIAKADVPVLVQHAGGNSSDTVNLVRGALAEAGFRVAPDGPFLTVELSPNLTQRDKFGNYYIFEGTCRIKIIRSLSDEVADKIVSVIGDRKLDQPQAQINAAKKLANECTVQASQLCETQLNSVESSIITISGRSDWQKQMFSKRMRKKSGIYVCRRITDEGRKVEYRVIFNAREHPDGIAQLVEDTLKVLGIKKLFL